MRPLTIRQVSIRDLDACHHIESRCFSASEAAARATLKKRIRTFPVGFLVGESGEGQVVGQVNSGATHQDDLADEAFKQLIGHDPEGKNLVIFSLSVLPDFQGRGIALQLMKEFIRRAEKDGRSAILLLCKQNLIAFYQRFGFIDRGRSNSTHGGAQWHEMVLTLNNTSVHFSL